MPKKKKLRKGQDHKRTEPYLKAHRSIIDLMLNEDTKEHLIKMAVREQRRLLQTEKERDDFFHQTFVSGILDPANEQLDPADQSDSLVLHSADGTYKIRVAQQNRRYFDDRVSEARALIQNFIDEYEQRVDVRDDMKHMISMLKMMFFGSHHKRKFKFTPELHDFMTKDPKELRDGRLKKAQEIMKKCYHVEKTRWYWEVSKYNEEEKKYEPITAPLPV